MDRKNYFRLALITFISFCFIFAIYSFNKDYINNFTKYLFISKSDLKINIEILNPGIKKVSAEESNRLLLKVSIKDSKGFPVPMAPAALTIPNGAGKVYPDKIRTNKFGEGIITYIPPKYLSSELINQANSESALNNVTIAANIPGAPATPSSISFDLVRPPVVLVHGYLASSDYFDNFKDFLAEKNFSVDAIDYSSGNGVIPSSKELDTFLGTLEDTYLNKGVLVHKFDLITHSMGGLVARYYTTNNDYIFKDNVRKIIFLSAPHKGSPWASISFDFFKDEGIRDLAPESELFTEIFPGLINMGLNPTIETGNLIVQYDEVVTPESASLQEWDIPIEMFNVGESSLDVNNLFSANLLQDANHKKILHNRKVFERVLEMLKADLPYPGRRK